MPPERAPTTPAHLLRVHLAAVNALYISDDNERLYSGDASGVVIVTSTRSFRPIAQWQAHKDGILTVIEWENQVITHGRDNKLHVWKLVKEIDAQVGETATESTLSEPSLVLSMDVNALNYCHLSLLPLRSSEEATALIALPNLVDSSLVDVWEIPSQRRLHAAIGKTGHPKQADGRGDTGTGIIMAVNLFQVTHPHLSSETQLRVLCAYENGSVALWAYTDQSRSVSIEGRGWEKLWMVKLHVETVMSMAVSRDNTLALTVSADHIIGRYDLSAAQGQVDVPAACTLHRMKHPGNGSVALRDDGRVCAIGGWDGKVRLFTTRSLKALGTLEYHKKSVQALIFAREITAGSNSADLEDEMSSGEKIERSRWLIVGSQDNRASIFSTVWR